MGSRTSHCSGLNPVFQLRLARRARAVRAAVDLSVGFNAVPDNPAVAVRANRRQRMDRALEAVEGVTFSTKDYLKRLVIFIFANFACSHTQILLSSKKEQIYFRQTRHRFDAAKQHDRNGRAQGRFQEIAVRFSLALCLCFLVRLRSRAVGLS